MSDSKIEALPGAKGLYVRTRDDPRDGWTYLAIQANSKKMSLCA